MTSPGKRNAILTPKERVLKDALENGKMATKRLI
jgi:hypothetical protein